jgi:uncharacterized protein (DUF4415 family)
MTDEEIDYTDIPPLADAFFEKAVLRIPAAQAQNWVSLDPEVVGWFKRQGEGFTARINEVLRQHIRAHQR